jgi:tRNA(Ile)-lysidine synthase
VGDIVLVALSGGADSTALLGALAELREAGELKGLVALNIDHGLRASGASDADRCAAVCARLGVEFRRATVLVAPGNVQAAARKVRYAALRREASLAGATLVATGHTRDDQAETVLLRLLRGSGARGLAGIPPRRGAIVRPLIDRSRAEVLAYLDERELPHVEDPSNATPRFLRNRVRAEVLPILRAIAPHAESALARAADLLRDDDRALSARGRRLVTSGTAQVEDLLREPIAVRRRAIRSLWKRATGRLAGLEAHHVESILDLLGNPAPSRAQLPGGYEGSVRYGEVSIRPVPAASMEHGATRLPGPGAHVLPDGAVLEVDGGSDASWPLWWRGRRPGDRFHPAGRKGSKKLKAWLIDEKVPREARDRLWVLADDDGRVIWIPELGARSEKPSVSASLRVGAAIPDCAGGPPCYIDRPKSLSGEAPGRGLENCASPTRPSCSGSS